MQLFGSLNSQQLQQNDHQPHMTLKAQCLPKSENKNEIIVTLYTAEPFYGLFYSRNYPSSCSIAGENSPSTSLVMQGDKCGFREVVRHGQEGVREVDIYIQHDSFVQQVIDEQFLVQCFPGNPEGVVNYHSGSSGSSGNPYGESLTRDVTVTSKFIGRSYRKAPDVKVKVSSSKEDATFFSNLVDTNLDVIAESPGFVEKTNEVSNENDNPGFAKASGWMELDWRDSNAAKDNLSVGQNVTWTIGLKHLHITGGDTMLSSCVAFAEGENEKVTKDLTDYKGCSVNKNVLPDFQVSFNSRTNVKTLKTSFGMFQATHMSRERLYIQCNVMICKRNCPVSKCDQESGHREHPRFPRFAIIDKFALQTQVSVKSDKNYFETELPGREKAIVANNLRQEKIDNEVTAIEESGKVAIIDESDLLCLSASKLILAFGILLFVLLVALAFSCILWLRARNGLARTLNKVAGISSNHQQTQHSMYAARMLQNGMPAPPPPPPPRRGLPPIWMSRGNTRMPYVRVMQ